MFDKYTWEDREVEYPNRRQLTDASTGTVTIQTVHRSEGTVTNEGDPFSAERMNDLEDRIKAECDLIEAAIADVQTTSVASKAYAKGSYLVYSGVLYKVTTAIASGGTISVGTNVTATNVGKELKSLQDGLTTANTKISNLTTSVNTSVNTINTTLAKKPTVVSFQETLSLDNHGQVSYVKDLRPYTSKTQAYFPVLCTGIETEEGISCSITDAHTNQFTIKITRLTGSVSSVKLLITYFIT